MGSCFAFTTPIVTTSASLRRHRLSSCPSSSHHALFPKRRSTPTTLYTPHMSVADGLWKVNSMPDVPSLRQSSGKKVAIVGAGLGGLITAMELVDAGFDVNIYDTRPFAGGKVGSWVDKDGNHIEMGLHVFFGCYYNLFDVMAKVGSFKHLLLKEHTHQFINAGGIIGALDFRLANIGAPFNGLKAFFTTSQLGLSDKLANAYALGRSVIVRGLLDLDGAMLSIRSLDNISFTDWFMSKGGSRGSIERMWDPIAYALGFIDCDNMSARCMLTIFQLFAARSEASVLRMLEGSPDNYLTRPIVNYIQQRSGKLHLRQRVRYIDWVDTADDGVRVTGLQIANGKDTNTVQADYYVAACDVKGMQRIVPPEWRKRMPEFEDLYRLTAVPVITVQLRFDGWVTELRDGKLQKSVSDGRGHGLDNLLYSADADFSCFADLAVTSPTDYYKEGEGSLMQCVLTPGDPYIKKADEVIVRAVTEQIHKLFPSSCNLNVTWSSVVKLAESLYREEPGMDVYRPKQKTSIDNFFLAGSYTFQDYIDSMEGAVKSGRLAAAAVLERVKEVAD